MVDSSVAVVLLVTDPYHAMTPLIKIALSQFSEADQTNNISQELSEKLYKLGRCQKLLTTKSDLTKIYNVPEVSGKQCHSSQVYRVWPYNLSAFLEDISFSLRGNSALMVKNSLHFIFNISSEKLHHNQICSRSGC